MKLTWRIYILIFAIIFSLLAIAPNPFKSGVEITFVKENSTAFYEGFNNGDIIIGIDNNRIKTVNDYAQTISKSFPSAKESTLSFKIKGSNNIIYTSSQPPEIIVENIPKNKILLGLDLRGGSRAVVKAKDVNLSASELENLIDVMNNRLNVYGISDVQVRPVADLEGNRFMLIEIAGATPKDLESLIAQQGKFEAKIGNDTVFSGGEKDITSVCKNDASCAGIERCVPSSDGEICTFYFVIYLSGEAAKHHAEITKNLSTNFTSQGRYLSKSLDLYLDDNLVDSLLISEGLKGQVTTQIQIQGSGRGATRDEAIKDAESSMKKLQTVLITGSLPYKLEILKLDTISPELGGSFTNTVLFAGGLAIFLVSIFILLRYKKIKLSLAVLFTSLSEVLIILGIASFIKWNIDLPGIAGILATIGTGVDQQIVILDESIQKNNLSLKEKMRRALIILVGTYLTAVVSLLPLLVAGAGLLRGFAVTTIIGITAGILISRPAFADMIKLINE